MTNINWSEAFCLVCPKNDLSDPNPSLLYLSIHSPNDADGQSSRGWVRTTEEISTLTA